MSETTIPYQAKEPENYRQPHGKPLSYAGTDVELLVVRVATEPPRFEVWIRDLAQTDYRCVWQGVLDEHEAHATARRIAGVTAEIMEEWGLSGRALIQHMYGLPQVTG